jgi:hypothetical protein
MASIPTPANKSEWLGVIDTFRAKAREFSTIYSDLYKRDPKKYPTLAAQRAELLARGSTIKNTVEKITGGVDKVWSFLKSTFGFSGFDEVEELGVVPLIPIAIVAAAITLMGKWLKDAYTLKMQFDRYDQLTAKGVSPERAADIVKGVVGGGGFFESIGKAVPLILLGVAVVIILPRFLKK